MNPSFLRRGATSLEPLESRIAPASVIRVGAPDPLDNDVNYTDSDPAQHFFINTETGGDSISMAVGGGAAGVADTFYIKLSAGDSMEVFNSSSSYTTFLSVNKGSMVAFFVDANGDNEVQDNELSGIALGKNTSFFLRGAVQGDVVTNYDSGTGQLDMAHLTTSGIKNVTIGGNGVGGAIIGGGTISNLTSNGNVGAVLAGSAVNVPDPNFVPGPGDTDQAPAGTAGRHIDFFPGVIGGDGRVTFNPAPGVAGASIQKIVIDAVTDRVQAGDGGFGAKGGSLKSIRVIEDSSGAIFNAGDGGDAGGGKASGGAGGSVSSVIFAPPDSGDDSPNSNIMVHGGAGGDAASGKAGAGGAVKGVLVSYRLINGKPFATTQLVQDNILIAGGDGGDGKMGGKAGGVSNSTIATVTAEDAGNELSILGGTGGDTKVASGGKTGAGGSVKDVSVQNQFVGLGGGILIAGGNGGLGALGVSGSAGGSVSKATLLGSTVQISGGLGSDGLKGGAGGAVKGITIDAIDTIFSRNAIINAGSGGKGLAGAGGKGGTMATVRIENGDFTILNVNDGTSANGGDSAKGKGGAGGAVSGLDFFEGDLNASAGGALLIRTGEGGDGTTGGGVGGALKSSRFSGTGMSAQILVGNGGDAAGVGAKGKGGVGGSATSLEIQAEGNVALVPASVSVLAGLGGDGAGAGGTGGNGGNLKTVSVRSEGQVLLQAGNGGSGTTGKAGDGGSIVTSGGFANQSFGAIVAGDGGAVGERPARGGDIKGTPANPVGLYGQTDITISAGDGTHGGAGGSLVHVGYGSTSSTLVPTPSGNILIEAGDGSVQGNSAGAGGSLKFVSGAVSSGANRTTVIRAGEGGSSFVAINVVETTQGDPGTQEVQTIDLSNVATTPNATMVLTYQNGTTGPLPVVPSASQTPADYALQLENALETLPGVGDISVTPGATANVYTVQFNTVDNKLPIGGTATVGTSAAAGGSINTLVIERGGSEGGVLTIKAGDAGDSKDPTGDKGGDVKGVSVNDIGATLLRSIAAGDGGDASQRGGVGGSVSNVDTSGIDIGVRFGLPYGYNSMGGIFAGAGGVSASGVHAASGSVTNITAESIASIVAGRGIIPEPTAKVDNIYLTGFNSIRESTGGILHSFPGTAVVVTVTDGVTTEQSAPIPSGLPASDRPGPDDSDPDDVEDILNAMALVQSAGGVTVTGNFFNGYKVTFNNNGDQPLDFSAEESFTVVTEETVPGQSPLTVVADRQGDNNPPAHEVQSFATDPTSGFVVSFQADTTNPLPANATATDVAAELNALPSIAAIGGVNVTQDAANHRFVVQFTAFQDIDETVDGLFATAVRPEVQTVDFYSTGEITFTYNGDSTGRLPYDATALEVQNAINALPSINATGPGGAGGAVSVTEGRNGAYIIEFNTVGDKDPIQGNQFSPDQVAKVDGTPTTQEMDTITIPVRTLFNTTQLPTANFVGAIADPLSLSGPTFQFIDFVSPSDPLDSDFEPQKGDIPLDGLIDTKVFVQQHTNFTPEALLVDGVFIDYKNNV